jgi:hypothetical protein
VGTSDFDVYHSYTQALRHPVIIGHVAGWRLPWALSASQLGAMAATTGLLLVTRPVWAHLGAVGILAVFTVALAGAAWAVRHWRVEGRSPFLFAAGVATVLVSPRCRLGIRNGGPATPPRPIKASTVGVLVAFTPVGAADG